jgi:N-acyl-D-aspartate/D-glutamate deacylase
MTTTDVVIRGGTVLDGTGADGFQADVAISGGRITGIGRFAGHADRTIDAGGHLVAPGFIDIHTHYDAQVFWEPELLSSSSHGVTTVVAGNCGFSLAPTRADGRELLARTLERVEDMDVASLLEGVDWDFESFPEYLASVEAKGSSINFAAMVGHSALRLFVMGAQAYQRAATEDERDTMARCVTEALAAGACGFATSCSPNHLGADGMPVPSRSADEDEFQAILDAVSRARRGIVAFAPGEPFGIRRLYQIQARLGIPITFGALLSSPDGTHDRILAVHRRGWADGGQVFPQVTPRPLTFQFTMSEPFVLNQIPRFTQLTADTPRERHAAYSNPSWRAGALEQIDDPAATGNGLKPRWDTFVIDECSSRPELIGRRVVEIAAKHGVHPVEVLLDAALEEPELKLRVRAILANDDEAAVARLLAEPNCVLGLSDAGAHLGQLCDAPQATDFLGSWVRDRSVMPIAAAVRKLTGTQADLLGLTDRGYLRTGAWADVAIFDPATVAPGPVARVADLPGGGERLVAVEPSGMTYVLVNGVPIREDAKPVEWAPSSRPGQIVRPPQRPPRRERVS